MTASTDANPALTSVADSTGKSGKTVRARADSPSAVPQERGIENHANPPRKYAFAVDAGFEAIARDQYPR